MSEFVKFVTIQICISKIGKKENLNRIHQN